MPARVSRRRLDEDQGGGNRDWIARIRGDGRDHEASPRTEPGYRRNVRCVLVVEVINHISVAEHDPTTLVRFHQLGKTRSKSSRLFQHPLRSLVHAITAPDPTRRTRGVDFLPVPKATGHIINVYDKFICIQSRSCEYVCIYCLYVQL